jgi:hypothetical protein
MISIWGVVMQYMKNARSIACALMPADATI